MIEPYFLTDEALDDLKNISIWYADKSNDLGENFSTKFLNQ